MGFFSGRGSRLAPSGRGGARRAAEVTATARVDGWTAGVLDRGGCSAPRQATKSSAIHGGR
jgi:hypothetical protein